jgi:DUF4097 and DUF4098 domain-containing protein YvlB
MKNISHFKFILVILMAQSIAACSNYNSDFTNGDLELIQEKTYPISWGKDLRIKANSGDVFITSWDKSEVHIKILGNENARKKLDFNFDNSDSYVELVAESKESFPNWFRNLSLKIEIKVPEKFNTEVHTSGGDVKLNSVDGNHQLNTSGGDVTCRGFSGMMEVSTSGGDVSLNGNDAPINAHTSGGDIVLDYFGENKGIDLSTSGGDILVKLPSDFNANMELSTSGGDVSCNLTMSNASKLSGHKIVAELNNGGNELIVHTSGGDIDVKKK